MKKLFVLTILSCLCLLVSTTNAEETPQEVLWEAATGAYNDDGTPTSSVDALLLLRGSLNRKQPDRCIKEKYVYDELNQLVEWEDTHSKQIYVYDDVGNRTSVESILK